MPRVAKKYSIDQFIIARVRKMRLEHGYSQLDLAVHLELSSGYISHIESPRYRAKYNLGHLNELAKLFKCSPRDFLPDRPLR